MDIKMVALASPQSEELYLLDVDGRVWQGWRQWREPGEWVWQWQLVPLPQRTVEPL